MFSLRIVNVDHYMSPPKPGLDLSYSQFRGSTIKSVPIIRIFGATPSGDKTCLHIHGVFPYILVPYSGAQDAGSVMYQLASSLDKAINVSLGTSYSNKQYVFKITQVSGRPFYGYHGQDHQFLKIFFYTPIVIKRACDLLQNGAVCGTRFQIHEGHVPFILQFFIDYNLYGMSFIDVKKVVYRKGISQPEGPVGSLSKDSCCKLEADAVAIDILNRIKTEGELAVNPGLAAIWEEEKKRLKKDMLDESSNRPSPPLAISEVLLKEKLLENLKLQGKCKPVLKEKIPYPAETQHSSSNDIFDASMLDTHSLSSLVSSQVYRDDITQIDEEVIHSLTQAFPMSSGEVSLLAALDDLAAHNDMSQNVEDDSVLGSQAVADTVSDDEEDLLNFSLSLPNPFEHDSCDDSDTSFEDNIPQLDGAGDIEKKEKKKKKTSSFEDKENNDIDQLDTSNDMKSNETSLLESENREIINEVFQDIEPFCSPLHDIQNIEDPDTLSLSDLSVFDDSEPDFNAVLKGDPSFTCKDSTFSEEIFPDRKIGCSSPNPILNSTAKCNSLQTTPLKEFIPKVSQMEKNSVLSDSNDDLLGMSSLEQLFDEDLSEEVETVCENHFDSTSSIEAANQNSREQFKEEDDENSDVTKVIEKEILTNVSRRSPRKKNTENNSSKSNRKLANGTHDTPSEDNILLETNLRIKTTSVKEIPVEIVSVTETITSPSKKSKCCDMNRQCVSGVKENRHLVINKAASITRMFKNKSKRNIILGKNDGWDMTNKEVEQYFSQLSKLMFEISKRTVSESTDPVSWSSIRHFPILVEKKVKHERRRMSCKSGNVRKQHSGRKRSKIEMNKLTSCFVLLARLSENELNSILKPKEKSDLEDEHQNIKNKTKSPVIKVNRSLDVKTQENTKPLVVLLKEKVEHHTESDKPKSLSSKNETVLLSSSTIKKPKTLRDTTVQDLNVVKNCQVVLKREENDILSKGSDETVTSKYLASPKHLHNLNVSKLLKNKKCLIQGSSNHTTNIHSNTNPEEETQGSKCKPNVDLKKVTPNTTEKIHSNQASLKELKDMSKLPKSNKKSSLNDLKKQVKGLSKYKNDEVKSQSLKTIQIVLKKHDLESKLDQKENLNKEVTGMSNLNMKECSNMSPSFKNVRKCSNVKSKPHQPKPLRKRNASLNMDLNPKEKPFGITAERRKRLKMFSLDGTCDTSSSSDEVVSEPSPSVECTPTKRKKSSLNVTNTPKSKYVPLQVEIKKSPTVKLERIPVNSENKSDFKEALGLSPKPDSKHEANSSTSKSCGETPLVPFVRIEKLTQEIKPLDSGNLPSGSYLKMNTKAYPLIKKLKISVKRLSTGEQGKDGGKSSRAKDVMYRRLSLPVTAK